MQCMMVLSTTISWSLVYSEYMENQRACVFWRTKWSSCEQSTFFANVKDSIRRETANISRNEVCHMSRHIFSRFKACLGGGQYRETLLWNDGSWMAWENWNLNSWKIQLHLPCSGKQ
jgi:hypothetical protein